MKTRARGTRLLMAILLVLSLFSLAALPTGAVGTPTITTDKLDYAPNETVRVTGSGFAAWTNYAVPIIRPDGTVVKGDGSFISGWDKSRANGGGNLDYSYKLDGIIGTYEVRVYPAAWNGSWDVAPLASVTFTDDFISLNLAAAAFDTYDHTTGGGAWNDGAPKKASAPGNNIAESLMPGEFKCNDTVTFLTLVTAAPQPENKPNEYPATSNIELTYRFLLDTTGQTGLALGPVTNVEMNYGAVQNGKGAGGTDSAINALGLGNTVAYWSQTAPDPSISPPYFTKTGVNVLTVGVTNIVPGETTVLRIDATVQCLANSGPTGNVQAAIIDANMCDEGSFDSDNPCDPTDKINVGNQTVPLFVEGETATMVTEIHNAATEAVLPLAPAEVPAGITVHDQATVTDTKGKLVPTGEVKFYWYTNGTCDPGVNGANEFYAGMQPLNNLGIAHPSLPELLAVPGAYSFRAFYSGDTTFMPAESPCEPLKAVLDTGKPLCSAPTTGYYTAEDGTLVKYIQVAVQDASSGLDTVTITKLINATADVGTTQTDPNEFADDVTPSMVPAEVDVFGATVPVYVRATKTIQTLSSTLAITFKDNAGNITTCDPVDVTIPRDSGKPVVMPFTGIPQAEHHVRIENSSPGLTDLQITVNGKVFAVDSLTAGQVRSLDISKAMKAGDNNTIVLTARGKPGGEAWVIISD